MGPNHIPYSERDSWLMLMNMADIPWDLLLDHEAKILMEIDPSQEVSNKKSQQGRLAIAYRVVWTGLRALGIADWVIHLFG